MSGTDTLRCRHTYTDAEKKAYIDAELCLMEKDPIEGFPTPAKNRHEELQTLHVLTTGINHGTVRPQLFAAYLPPSHNSLIPMPSGFIPPIPPALHTCA